MNPARDSLEACLRALTALRRQQTLALADVGAIAYDDRQADKYLVEIYKKYSIPFACIAFGVLGLTRALGQAWTIGLHASATTGDGRVGAKLVEHPAVAGVVSPPSTRA